MENIRCRNIYYGYQNQFFAYFEVTLLYYIFIKLIVEEF